MTERSYYGSCTELNYFYYSSLGALVSLVGSEFFVYHGNGITARYCGLNTEPAVKKGDKVDSSVQIGSLGDIPSESVEQVHLHLEFYQNGKSADPLKFFSSK